MWWMVIALEMAVRTFLFMGEHSSKQLKWRVWKSFAGTCENVRIVTNEKREFSCGSEKWLAVGGVTEGKAWEREWKMYKVSSLLLLAPIIQLTWRKVTDKQTDRQTRWPGFRILEISRSILSKFPGPKAHNHASEKSRMMYLAKEFGAWRRRRRWQHDLINNNILDQWQTPNCLYEAIITATLLLCYPTILHWYTFWNPRLLTWQHPWQSYFPHNHKSKT